MKKILVVLMIVMMLATLCACNYVPSTRFLSKAQVNAIAGNFDDPQAEMTLNYTSNGENVEVKITYNLLLTKTPLAAIRFIQLTNEGFYDDTVVDYYNSTNHYWTLGRYRYEESKIQTQGKMVYLQNPCDKTFKGEFESNGYGMPKGGYAKFRILSLAMYYEPWTETDNTFDTANGHLIMSAANESSNASTLNSANYAVFAEMDSISVRRTTDGEFQTFGKVPSDILSQLTGFTSRTSRDVYDDDSEANKTSVSLMTTVVKIHVKMLGDYDWSKLPRVGR